MLPLAFGELTGIWTQEDNKPPDKTSIKFQTANNTATSEPLNHNEAMITGMKDASIEQFGIPNLVNKESPVLSSTNKVNIQIPTIGKSNRKIARTDNSLGFCNPTTDGILSSLKISTPPSKK